ncbi:MAG TPA: ATP-binding protein, partial [Kiloniellales bacterium]
DNGGGVPEDIHERIFDPFFTLKEMGKGNGLGLALCRRLIADMGGRITLHNDDQGAVFEITLHPAESQMAEPRVAPASSLATG